ncbi:MAG: 2,4-dienoyl-CoA reductase-like NADH-dependent reductase (Old Yellow Enzyme family) [Cocleimonas sp.]|jgi:2,4-dienoyl-CoA reductase-like NADH-dependent reductase (Old Yellow Enzyme family)
MSNTNVSSVLFQPLELPCGTILKNRVIKSAMSDSLGDGRGNPTDLQNDLYERWSEGGIAASIIGEVQYRSDYAEKPGNLVLNSSSDKAKFTELAKRGSINGALLWPQLGHAGAMAHPPISHPKGPSKIEVPGLSCEALTPAEIKEIPNDYAQSAVLAKELGFGGVQLHSAHGFLLSQFLSPLFNQRTDEYGGSIASRSRLLLEVIAAVRDAVGPNFPIALKLNSSDMLDGGLEPEDSMKVVSELDKTSIDLIDISGGTYFPGAKSASDGVSSGAYFLEFAKQARTKTKIPLMLTGGFKSFEQANEALNEGSIDIVGVARALALDPELVKNWQQSYQQDSPINPVYPRFDSPPVGGITAWYTMRLTDIAMHQETDDISDLEKTIVIYENRDAERTETWNKHFKT